MRVLVKAVLVFVCLVATTPYSYSQLIDVAKISDVNLAESEIDNILSQGNSSIQIDGSPGLSCLLTLHRDNPIVLDPYGTIAGPSDLAGACAQPGYVKVVDSISWCGTGGPNIIGCAFTPGNCVVVVRYNPSLEWILWMHEYSHSKGLSHRATDTALMNPTINATHNSLSGSECAIAQNIASSGTSGPPQTSTPIHAFPVTAFVKKTFIEGTPYRQARLYKGKDVTRLIGMLNDGQMLAYRANVVATLGMTGDKRATRVLIDFISSALDLAVPDDRRSCFAALISLGYVANANKDDDALNFLIQSTSSSLWEQRLIPAGGASKAKTSNVLAGSVVGSFVSAAMMGLALSGTQKAAQALSSLHEKSNEGDLGLFVK